MKKQIILKFLLNKNYGSEKKMDDFDKWHKRRNFPGCNRFQYSQHPPHFGLWGSWLWKGNKFFRPDLFRFWRMGFPFVDYEETSDEYLLKIEVPGIEKDRITSKATGDTLVVEIDEKSHYYPLPTNIIREKISASLNLGILTIHLPKKESDQKVDID